MAVDIPAPLPVAPATVQERVVEVLGELKPRMRGWLHAGVLPVTLALGIVLVVGAPAGAPRLGAVVFTACAMALFGSSTALHRGRWSPRLNTVLTRVDHACIFLLIAGSYTPFALTLLQGRSRTALLLVAWGGAALGITFRLLWTSAPRWIYTPVYLALGWVSVLFAGAFAERAGVGVLVLLALGGLLYTVGAVVYGFRRPNPFPQWFGFHEVFHAFTVLAFVAHYCAVTLATAAVR